jgi:hypothetical protein
MVPLAKPHCGQITGESHSPVLRSQDLLIVVKLVAEVGEVVFAHVTKRTAHGDGATGEQVWVDVGLHEAEVEVQEQHQVAVLVETRIHQHTY